MRNKVATAAATTAYAAAATFAAAALVAFVLSLSLACASTNAVKKAGYVGLSAAGQAIWLAQGTEMGLVCGRDSAPPAPVCVPLDVHKNDISPRFAKANAIGEKASAALAALPPEISRPTPEIFTFVTEIWDLLSEIRSLIPDSTPKKKLVVELDKLAAKK